MEPSNESPPPAAAATTAGLPRRALRKGTHSCAECKKRKVRCFFEGASSPSCVWCTRRNLPCISQEFVDVPESEAGDLRLQRVERMVESILSKVQEASYAKQQPDGPSSPWSHSGTPLASRPAGDWNGLHSAFPPQREVDVLLGPGAGAIFVQMLCNPYNDVFPPEQPTGAAKTRARPSISALPSASAHPVLLARPLLQIAICLQQLDPSFDKSTLGSLGTNCRDDMNRYFELASGALAGRDDLLDSLEGLECLVYEATFLVNSGSLRRALLTLRRATTLAQLMGLHRQAPRQQPRMLDRATRVSTSAMWVHIAYLELYVALLLGMPSCVAGPRFAHRHRPEGETPSEWMERAQIDIFDRIVSRNVASQYHDPVVTRDIDGELTRISNSVPSSWWLLMQQPGPEMTAQGMVDMTIRAVRQIIHYNLLTVLHLPFLLRSNSGGTGTGTRSDELHESHHLWEYSKNTCLYASREVLTRYIALRAVVRTVFCCRPADFCALAAVLALLVAHIHSHDAASSTTTRSHHPLAHQRHSDRGLIDKVIGLLEELNQLNHDDLSRETARLARKLLALEERCAQGEPSLWRGSVVGDEPVDGGGGDQDVTTSREDSFSLTVPYFGTIRLARAPPVATTNTPASSSLSPSNNPSYSSSSSSLLPSTPGMWQVPSMTASSSTTPATTHPFGGGDGTGQQRTQMGYDHHQMMNQSNNNPLLVCGPLVAYAPDKLDVPMQDMAAGPDLWAFQGVDTFVFDSLVGGTGCNADGDFVWST